MSPVEPAGSCEAKQSTPEKAVLAESASLKESGSLREQGSEDPPKRKRLGWGQGLARLQSKDTRLSGADTLQALPFILPLTQNVA